MSPVSSRSTLYESVRQGGGATNLIDSLQSQLKQRDGEIFQLRVREPCVVFTVLCLYLSLFSSQVSFSDYFFVHLSVCPSVCLLTFHIFSSSLEPLS